MVNPYYVKPGNDYGPGLRGLADTVGQIGEKKRKEQAMADAAKKAVAAASGSKAD